MKLTSPVFREGGKIPSKYTCDGEGVNPPLNIEDIPRGAISLVLIVDDPDVPVFVRKDRMWVHWVVFNLPPTLHSIPENMIGIGTPGINTEGTLTYQGPCPPDREHRYFFKLYALNIRLDINPGVTKEALLKAMEGNVISSTELMGKYERG